MNKMRGLLFGSLASLMALGSSAAMADCVQANFQGIYQAYITIDTGSGVAWTQCRLTISGTGTIANTSCTTSLSPATVPLTGASVKLSSGPFCTFTATFKVASTTQTAKQITLSDDHNFAKGVGTSPATFLVDLIRIN